MLGVVTTVAGQTISGYAEGTGTNAMFGGPTMAFYSSSATLYVSDAGNNRLRLVTLPGTSSARYKLCCKECCDCVSY